LCDGVDDAPAVALSPRNAQRAAALAARHPSVSVAADNQAVIDGAAVPAIARWLAAQGVPADQAERYVAAIFAGLAETLAAGKLDGLAEAHATPGGINEQFARLLTEAGAFEAVGRSLDAVLRRLRA
jgi:hypothetical protein